MVPPVSLLTLVTMDPIRANTLNATKVILACYELAAIQLLSLKVFARACTALEVVSFPLLSFFCFFFLFWFFKSLFMWSEFKTLQNVVHIHMNIKKNMGNVLISLIFCECE